MGKLVRTRGGAGLTHPSQGPFRTQVAPGDTAHCPPTGANHHPRDKAGAALVPPWCSPVSPPWHDLGPLTVEGDVRKALEQGNASAQLLCLCAAPLQLCSVVSGERVQAEAQDEVRRGAGPGSPVPSRAPAPWTYSSSRCSMAKARTVRTLPRASSATPVALATCVASGKQAGLVMGVLMGTTGSKDEGRMARHSGTCS